MLPAKSGTQMLILRRSALGMSAVLFATVTAVAQTPRVQPRGENLSAGKTPAQLFATDCASCHTNPAALAKGRRPAQIADFLVQHYTSSRQVAGLLGAYVASLRTPTPPVRPSQRPVAADDPRSRPQGEVEAAGTPTADPAPLTEAVVPEPRATSPPVPQTLDTLEVYD